MRRLKLFLAGSFVVLSVFISSGTPLLAAVLHNTTPDAVLLAENKDDSNVNGRISSI